MDIERIIKITCRAKHPFRAQLSILILVSFLFFPVQKTSASKIILLEKDAVVWRQLQTVSGTLSGFISPTVNVDYNGKTLSVPVKKDSTFSLILKLNEEPNNI